MDRRTGVPPVTILRSGGSGLSWGAAQAAGAGPGRSGQGSRGAVAMCLPLGGDGGRAGSRWREVGCGRKTSSQRERKASGAGLPQDGKVAPPPALVGSFQGPAPGDANEAASFPHTEGEEPAG